MPKHIYFSRSGYLRPYAVLFNTPTLTPSYSLFFLRPFRNYASISISVAVIIVYEYASPHRVGIYRGVINTFSKFIHPPNVHPMMHGTLAHVVGARYTSILTRALAESCGLVQSAHGFLCEVSSRAQLIFPAKL